MKWIKDVLLSCFGGCVMNFVDLRKTKTIWFKWYNKETFKFRGMEYVIDRKNMLNKTCQYNSNYAEPLTATLENDDIKYKITTREFSRAYNNKLLTLLLYVQEKDLIKYILYISVLIALAAVYSAVTLYNMTKVIV